MDNARTSARMKWVLFSCVEYAFLGCDSCMPELWDAKWVGFFMNLSFFFVDFGRMNIEWNVGVFGFKD